MGWSFSIRSRAQTSASLRERPFFIRMTSVIRLLPRCRTRSRRRAHRNSRRPTFAPPLHRAEPALSAVLLVLARGAMNTLVPLFAVGVFVGFTIADVGMVRHWWLVREGKLKGARTPNLQIRRALGSSRIGVVTSARTPRPARCQHVTPPQHRSTPPAPSAGPVDSRVRRGRVFGVAAAPRLHGRPRAG